MNCDQVFDILTRGPFPAGEPSDAAVERHLCACHECRELAEALQPSVSLFHESINPDEGAELPGYRGALWNSSALEPASAQTAVAMSAVSAPPTGGSLVTRRSSRISSSVRTLLLRVAAVATLAGALAALIVGIVGFEAGVGNRQVSSNAAALAADGGGPTTLASFEFLPQDCYRLTKVFPPERRSEALCCTHCHARALSEAPPLGESVVLVARSCRHCHES
jgi:hypothetical protein